MSVTHGRPSGEKLSATGERTLTTQKGAGVFPRGRIPIFKTSLDRVHVVHTALSQYKVLGPM